MNNVSKRHIVHIGFPKTASTWLQKNFFVHARNVVVVDEKVIKRDIISPTDFVFDSKVFWENDFSEERLVVSDENLIGSIHDGGLQLLHTKEMLNRIKTLFPNDDVVLFLRNQVSIITSGYLQYVKMGGNYSVNKFLFDKDYSFTATRKLFNFDFLNYYELISYCKRLFGEDRFFVYLYEDFSVNPYSFIQKFVANHQLDVEVDKLDFSRVNRRYGKSMFVFARFLNSFTKRPLINKYYIIHIPFWYGLSMKLKKWMVNRIFKNSSMTDEKVLGRKTLRYIKEYFYASNEQLAIELGRQEDFKKYGYLD